MDTLGWFHTAAAVTALASGAAVLTRRKGTRSHRRVGWVYAASMLALNASALLIYRLFGGFGPFHAAALVSLATLLGGMIPAVRRRPAHWYEHHYRFMTWSYVGLLAAAVSEVGTRVPGARFWWAVLVGTAAVIGVGATLIRRREAPLLAPFRAAAARRAARNASA
ncbi:MAG TPA: DUF2306 domain-containing protein [Longimicrobium sp.]|jgi:uncharacterized membrane protein